MPHHHRHRGRNERDTFIRSRLFIGLVGAALVLLPGIVVLATGHQYYQNTWGALVFAPAAVLVGILAIVFAVRGVPKSLR